VKPLKHCQPLYPAKNVKFIEGCVGPLKVKMVAKPRHYKQLKKMLLMVGPKAPEALVPCALAGARQPSK
jgi:hypothetical protein